MWVSFALLRLGPPSALKTAGALFQGKDLFRNFGYTVAQITPRPVVHPATSRKPGVIKVQLCFQLVLHRLQTIKMSQQAHHVLASLTWESCVPTIGDSASIVIHKNDRLKKQQPNRGSDRKNLRRRPGDDWKTGLRKFGGVCDPWLAGRSGTYFHGPFA
jgi:hypothetical protein